MPPKPLTVVIVGGSLGGLFPGVVMKRLGHNVRILERSTTPLYSQGAGVSASEDTQLYLSSYDLTERSAVIFTAWRKYIDFTGDIVRCDSYGHGMTSWSLLYDLLRANFDSRESASCNLPQPVPGEGEAIYQVGHTLLGIRENGATVDIDFKNDKGEMETMSADLVLAADGPSSTVRSLLCPDVKRRFVGYAAWRGTAPESELYGKDALVDSLTFHHSEGLQMLAFLIPGETGSLEPGKRLMNWVWYNNYAEGSKELDELMTDKNGHKHRYTVPAGLVQDNLWTKQRELANKILPPQFAEVVNKTTRPFVTVITDVISPRASFFNGKVLLIGDAVCGVRPHTASGVNQAALHANLLAHVFKGEMTLQEWERRALEYARIIHKRGIEMGEMNQFGRQPPNPSSA